MCCLGVSWRGVGAPRFTRQGKGVNTEKFLDVFEYTYAVDIASQFGQDPQIPQQDGAPCRTSRLARPWCAENFRPSWPKDAWPPCSPNLVPLQCFVWGWMQGGADEKDPSNALELKVAIT